MTSLADLGDSTQEHFVDAAIGALNWRRFKACNRLREIKRQKYDDEFFPPMLTHLGALAVLELMLQDAANDDYPIVYDQGRQKLETLDHLITYAEEVISSAERWSPAD